MHPASTLQLLSVPRAMAQRGVHVLCAGSRYTRNDTALIMEKVVFDFGTYVRHAKEHWGYDKVVIACASHYYVGQPELLHAAIDLCIDWMKARALLA
jgi:hypothetical protein